MPGLPEDVALAVGEVGLESIAGGNCASESILVEQRKSEASGVEGGLVGIVVSVGAGVTRAGTFGSTAGSQRHDGIGDAIVNAVEDAAHGAGIVDHAVGLSALENGAPVKAPSVGQFALQRGPGEELRQFVVVAEVEHVSAVKVR